MPQIDANRATVDVVVVGGGMAGLAAADGLVSRGLSVELIEAAQDVGGLARSILVGGEELEVYYHHRAGGRQRTGQGSPQAFMQVASASAVESRGEATGS